MREGPSSPPVEVEKAAAHRRAKALPGLLQMERRRPWQAEAKRTPSSPLVAAEAVGLRLASLLRPD
jgi:hypothetical protein